MQGLGVGGSLRAGVSARARDCDLPSTRAPDLGARLTLYSLELVWCFEMLLVFVKAAANQNCTKGMRTADCGCVCELCKLVTRGRELVTRGRGQLA